MSDRYIPHRTLPTAGYCLKLEAENARLREALEEIVNAFPDETSDGFEMLMIAKAALEQSDE